MLYAVPCDTEISIVSHLYMDPVIIQTLSSIEKLPDDFFPEIEQLIEHTEVVLTPFLNNDSRNIHVLSGNI